MAESKCQEVENAAAKAMLDFYTKIFGQKCMMTIWKLLITEDKPQHDS